MLKPLEIIKRVSKILQKKKNCEYCLAGGHAASLYRSEERFTKDIDFALCAQPLEESESQARLLIEELGFEPVLGFIPQRDGSPQTRGVGLVTTSPESGQLTGLVDVLLPTLPWVEGAVRRAQENLIDLGFALVPVITPEDLIVAKTLALQNAPDRFQDFDDIKQIFQNIAHLDREYIKQAFSTFSLRLPQVLRKYSKIK